MVRLLRALVALALLVPAGVLLAPAAPASAATCGGDWVYRQVHKDVDGRNVAEVNYYKSATKTCFVMESIGPWKGIEKYMSLTVCGDQTCKSNSGQFASYAGPVSHVIANEGNCHQLYLIVREPSGRTLLHTSTWGGSCN